MKGLTNTNLYYLVNFFIDMSFFLVSGIPIVYTDSLYLCTYKLIAFHKKFLSVLNRQFPKSSTSLFASE